MKGLDMVRYSDTMISCESSEVHFGCPSGRQAILPFRGNSRKLGRPFMNFPMKNGRALKGHHSIITKIGIVPPGYLKSPSGGYDISCLCGWQGGIFKTKAPARTAYRKHIDYQIDNCNFIYKRCGASKPGTEMRHDYRYMCLRCFSKKGNEWAAANRAKNHTHKRRHHLLIHFGMTLEEYEAILQSQNNLCAICMGSLKDPRGFAPHIDHDHLTGKIRGILCQGCNNGLGNFKDNIKSLLSAVAYLRRNGSRTGLSRSKEEAMGISKRMKEYWVTWRWNKAMKQKLLPL
jgi:Recombination endonuclease VII